MPPLNRRDCLKTLAVAAAAATGVGMAGTSTGQRKSPTVAVRDRLWVWAHMEGSYNGSWGLPRTSRITPVEGAHYLGVPNVIFIRYEGKPAPPFAQYAIPFRSLKQVFWSITGAGGVTSDAEREHVFQLAAKMPNLTGVFMDDFFRDVSPTTVLPEGPLPAAMSVEQLRKVREQLHIGGRRLDLGVTVYTTQLSDRARPHLSLCDVISLWTWKATELKHLEENFAKLRHLVPDKRLFLGCYMWDFDAPGRPMPLELMQHQCDFALKRLKAGEIEGVIFLATNLCDLDLETVEWTRQWIAQHGNDSFHL